MKHLVIAVALLIGITASAQSEDTFDEQKARQDYEKFLQDAEHWICVGNSILYLTGDFKGRTPEERGLGFYYLNFDMSQKPIILRTFAEVSGKRIWIRRGEIFIIEGTGFELVQNLEIKGTYSRFDDSGDYDPAEYSEFRCQRFDGMTEPKYKNSVDGGQMESALLTWRGEPLSVMKIN